MKHWKTGKIVDPRRGCENLLGVYQADLDTNGGVMTCIAENIETQDAEIIALVPEMIDALEKVLKLAEFKVSAGANVGNLANLRAAKGIAFDILAKVKNAQKN
jgi:hypothetical protein